MQSSVRKSFRESPEMEFMGKWDQFISDPLEEFAALWNILKSGKEVDKDHFTNNHWEISQLLYGLHFCTEKMEILKKYVTDDEMRNKIMSANAFDDALQLIFEYYGRKQAPDADKFCHGICLFCGIGTEKNFEVFADEMKSLCASDGLIGTQATFYYGRCLFQGRGVKKDVNLAGEKYKAAAGPETRATRYDPANFFYALYLHRQHDTDINSVLAHCKESEYAPARFLYGLCVEGNEEQIAKCYQESADKGWAPAQFFYGIYLYKNGGDFFKYFELAAKQEYAPAQDSCGYCLKHGVGTVRDKKLASEYFEGSAKKTNSRGDYYSNGCTNYARFLLKCDASNSLVKILQNFKRGSQGVSFRGLPEEMKSKQLIEIRESEWEDDNCPFLPCLGRNGQLRKKKKKDSTDTICVEKRFNPQGDPKRSFIRELCIWLYEHPCIVPMEGVIYPAKSKDSAIYTKYMKEGSLEHWLASRKSMTDRTIAILGIVIGMWFIQQHKIIHRDLKTANIFMDENNCARIGDFDIAVFDDANKTADDSSGTCSHGRSTGIGTKNYRAPEASTADYGLEIDVFSFSRVFCEIVGAGIQDTETGEMYRTYNVDETALIKAGINREIVSLIVKASAYDDAIRPSFEDIFRCIVNQEFKIFASEDIDVSKILKFVIGILAKHPMKKAKSKLYREKLERMSLAHRQPEDDLGYGLCRCQRGQLFDASTNFFNHNDFLGSLMYAVLAEILHKNGRFEDPLQFLQESSRTELRKRLDSVKKDGDDFHMWCQYFSVVAAFLREFSLGPEADPECQFSYGLLVDYGFGLPELVCHDLAVKYYRKAAENHHSRSRTMCNIWLLSHLQSESPNLFEDAFDAHCNYLRANNIIASDVAKAEGLYSDSYAGSHFLLHMKGHYSLANGIVLSTASDDNASRDAIMYIPRIVNSLTDSKSPIHTQLKCVEFEENSSLKRIGNFWFSGCHLENLCIPCSVTSIGKESFSSCCSLKYVEFEQRSELRSIEDSAFSETGLEKMDIPASVEKIGCRCFSNCHHLKTFSCQKGSKLCDLHPLAFFNCSIVNVELSGKFHVDKDHGFVLRKNDDDKCTLVAVYDWKSEVSIPNSVSDIAEECFCDHGLEKFVVPCTLRSIEAMVS